MIKGGFIMEIVFKIVYLVWISFIALWLVASSVLFIVKKTIGRRAKIPEVEPIFDEKGFIDFCYGLLSGEERLKRAATEVENLNKKVASISKNLRKVQAKLNNKKLKAEALALRDESKNLSEQLKTAQLELSKSKARLNKLREHKEDAGFDSYTYEQAKNDFQQLKSMRGVCQIFVDDTDTMLYYGSVKEKTLKIYVRATYARGRYLYDLGDYMIDISQSQISDLEWEVNRIRFKGQSGYGGRHFCFGDRFFDICDYIERGRIVEAVEIMIECLHYVNEGRDQETIHDNYEIVRRFTRRERKELKNN